jgi:NAD-dependent SIR2 family protein deacetylase
MSFGQVLPERSAGVDPDPDPIEALRRAILGKRVALLTGAGVSTDSGIPDYRSPGRPPRRPIQHQEFVASDAWRRRYWARSVVGWPRFRSAAPSAVHQAIAALEARVELTALVTQNVDRLHQRAGSRRVIELHGALAEVRCLGCGAFEERDELQARLLALNPTLGQLSDEDAVDFETRPDGDVELSGEAIERFVVAGCLACGGVLMPNVVFFGGSVPKPIVEASYAAVEAAEVLLVLGTSLTVFSGFRFVKRAHERGIPVAIVNRGPTRGDPLATLRLDAGLAEILPALAG